jgi:hypothetical protein
MEFLKNLLSDKTYTDLVAKLGEDLVKQINEKSKDFKIDIAEEKLIPKTKFDEINTQLKDSKTQITERDKQLETLKEGAKGNEELTKQIEDLKTANENANKEYQEKLLAREKEFETETLIASSGAKNVKAVRALLDPEKDAKEQIEALKKSDDYLFVIDKSKDGAGKAPGSKKKQTSSISEEQLAKFRGVR